MQYFIGFVAAVLLGIVFKVTGVPFGFAEFLLTGAVVSLFVEVRGKEWK